jgi:hypothetical protein
MVDGSTCKDCLGTFTAYAHEWGPAQSKIGLQEWWSNSYQNYSYLRDMVDITNRPKNALIGTLPLALNRNCGVDSSYEVYDSHTGKTYRVQTDFAKYDGTRESGEHYWGGFCKMRMKTVEWVGDADSNNEVWSSSNDDVLYMPNEKCNDCLGTWDEPGWEGNWPSPAGYAGWQANTYRNNSNRPNEVISMSHRPKQAFFGRWINGFSHNDCTTTDADTTNLFCEVKYEMREFNESSRRWEYVNNIHNERRVYTQGFTIQEDFFKRGESLGGCSKPRSPYTAI